MFVQNIYTTHELFTTHWMLNDDGVSKQHVKQLVKYFKNIVSNAVNLVSSIFFLITTKTAPQKQSVLNNEYFCVIKKNILWERKSPRHGNIYKFKFLFWIFTMVYFIVDQMGRDDFLTKKLQILYHRFNRNFKSPV